jgi:ADP-ribosyl-[dinitrogen reductase] hydrolase
MLQRPVVDDDLTIRAQPQHARPGASALRPIRRCPLTFRKRNCVVNVPSSVAYDAILGCLLGGAIGDAFGGVSERGEMSLSDDTQLTLATCESIVGAGGIKPEHLAETFRDGYRARRFTGVGSSTLKALTDLEAGAHWALSGAQGEMAAGNGGAMRIAPLAFLPDVSRATIRDVVRITHRHDEAYVGALAVVEAIRAVFAGSPVPSCADVAGQLPESKLRDRLIAWAAVRDRDFEVQAVKLGVSGYVVDTVPVALAAARRMENGSFEETLDMLIALGGDTDTIASIAGQIAGARLGLSGIPESLISKLPERATIEETARRFAAVALAL